MTTHDDVKLSQTMTDWGRLPQAAIRGRELYYKIRNELFDLRNRSIPVLGVVVSEYASHRLHAMWDFLTVRYDMKLPFRIERVPMKVGSTGGKDYEIIKGRPGIDPLTPYIEGLSPVSDRPQARPGSLRAEIANLIGTEAASKLTH